MGIIENVKEAAKLVQQIDNIELYRKILDLQSEAMELIEKLKRKDEEVLRLRKALELKGKLIYKNNAYFFEDENGNKEGPFCTKCFDVDKVQCRLVPDTKGYQVICPNCKVSSDNKPLYYHLRPDVKASDEEPPNIGIS